MQVRKNIKRKRRISLIIKSLWLIALLCIMISSIMNKFSSDASRSPGKTDTENTSSKAHRIALKGLSQDGIPTGCEAVSTVAVLRHLGIRISVDRFIEDFLPCQDFYRKNDRVYGADPHEYFAGSPYKTASLGCYPKVILKALNNMKNANYPGMDNLHFKDVSSFDIKALLTNYIDFNIPVIFWVTIDMKQPYDGMKYALEDGTAYTWTAQEHCTVLCGYDKDSYYLMDPLKDGEIIAYPRNIVETRYKELGKYALVVIPSDFL